MRVIQRLASIAVIAIFIAVFTCVSAGLAYTQNSKEIQRQSPSQPQSSEVTAEIPSNPDIAFPKPVTISNFAWRDFVALNWPANCEGEPLANKKIGEAPDAPRIWEFYRTPGEVFLSEGKDPTSIKPTNPSNCWGKQHEPKVLRITESGRLATEDEFRHATTLVSDSLVNEDGELAIPIQEVLTLNSIPLVDQQGNYVINETRISPVEFTQIIKNKWYDAHNLEGFNDESNQWFQLACSAGNNSFTNPICSEHDQVGTIEIKAAWRVFDSRNSDAEKSRYYTTKRELLIPARTDKCDVGKAVCSDTGQDFKQVVEVGLIGLHIAHKTSRQGWVWSTFEHVDNVPEGTPKSQQYTLYNPNCAGSNCDINTPYVKAPYLWRNDFPHAVTRIEDKIEPQIASQIVRAAATSGSSFPPETREQLQKLTQYWQGKLKETSNSSVWQYYKLVGIEWLGFPTTPYKETIRDRSPKIPALTNVALEPYQQNISCISCHTGARLANKAHSDFSFLMKKAQPSNSSMAEAQ